MDWLSRPIRWLPELPVVKTISWRVALITLVLVHSLVVVPVVVTLLEGTGDFALPIVLMWIGLGLTSILAIDAIVAWTRVFFGKSDRLRLLQIALFETSMGSLVLLLMLSI